MSEFRVKPIGKVAMDEEGMFIELEPRYIPALQALEGFRHLQIIWWFSGFDNADARQILEVPKPYKKSPEVMGIFATRSPIRPNPIALSAAEVIQIDQEAGRIQIA